jgi:hypothetical protein
LKLTDIACDRYGNIVGGNWFTNGEVYTLKYYPDHEIEKRTEFLIQRICNLPKLKNPTGVCFDKFQNLYVFYYCKFSKTRIKLNFPLFYIKKFIFEKLDCHLQYNNIIIIYFSIFISMNFQFFLKDGLP